MHAKERGRDTARVPVDAPHTPPEMAELDRLARLLDARFSLLGIRFGWDSILGLIPGLGDLVTLGPAAYLLVRAHRMGARRRVLARMALNSGIDTVVGGIPLVGDIFDLAWKSNLRNVELLRREMARKAERARPVGE